MKVHLGQEMWVLGGELILPLLRFRNGKSALGLSEPNPIVLKKGQEVEIASFGQERMDPSASVLGSDGQGPGLDLSERVTDEFLAAMGHAKDECACWCKGCNSGHHCHDQRCYPLYD